MATAYPYSLATTHPHYPRTSVGAIWSISSFSEASTFRIVVLPALSRPSRRIRSSRLGCFRSFLSSDSKPWEKTSNHAPSVDKMLQWYVSQIVLSIYTATELNHYRATSYHLDVGLFTFSSNSNDHVTRVACKNSLVPRPPPKVLKGGLGTRLKSHVLCEASQLHWSYYKWVSLVLRQSHCKLLLPCLLLATSSL